MLVGMRWELSFLIMIVNIDGHTLAVMYVELRGCMFDRDAM